MTNKTIIYQVAVAFNSNNSIWDYKSTKKLNIGQIVKVSVKNKEYLGVIWGNDSSNILPDKLKEILEIYKDFYIKKEILEFLKKLSTYTMSPLGGFIKLYLSHEQYLKKFTTAYISLLSDHISEIKLTPKRRQIIEFLKQHNNTYLKERLTEHFSRNIINELINKGVLKEYSCAEKFQDELYEFHLLRLNSYQEKSYLELKPNIFSGYKCSLFAGVTGSGKTEVYLKLIADILPETKGQILIMLPEIMLTKEMVKRFQDRLGKLPLIWHSGLTLKERRRTYQHILSGKSAIIIGARSALFLPYQNLSLIIVDEEHDPSYKQEETIIYNARDAAVLLANSLNIPIILSTATPSIESYHNVLKNKYFYSSLKVRHKEIEPPEILIEDLNKTKLPLDKYISPNLFHLMNKEIDRGKQVLLFLNRKGFAPITICNECGFTYKCRNCSTNLVYHDSRKIYLCHYCGFIKKATNDCPSCHKLESFRYCGAGIEKILEEVKNYFPDKKIAVLSSDYLHIKNSHEVLKDIHLGNVNIIIGTQIISKGYHFKKLSLVGVIDADVGLLNADLRAAEKNFQIINQVVGRAGREEKGKAFIQTYYPKNNLLEAIKKSDYEGFYQYELNIRKIAELPPFKRLVALIISSPSKPDLIKFLQKMQLHQFDTKNIMVMGPIEAPIYIIRSNYRYRFLLKADFNVNIQQYIRKWLKNIALPHNIKLKIDVDPYSFM